MVRPLARLLFAVAVLYIAARPTAAEEGSPLIVSTSSAQDEPSDSGIVSVEFRPRGGDGSFNLPASVRFAPASGPTFVRDAEFTIVSALSLHRRATGAWVVAPLEGVSISAHRQVANRSSFTISIASHSGLTRATNTRYAADVSMWVGRGPHELSFAAGLSRDSQGTTSRMVSAVYVGRFSDQLRGSADVAYAAGGATTWVAASGGLMYQLMSRLQLDLSVRHQRAERRPSSGLCIGATVRTS
jgi:hypothetical protein